jgi:transcriptional regulator with XRE-family HTH domain
MDGLAQATGAALRDARRAAGLSLSELSDRSGGRFKPSSLGGYERGERALSLARFCVIADLLNVPADQLLGDILDRLRPDTRRGITIDLRSLPSSAEGRVVARRAHELKAKRGDFLSQVVGFRASDLEVLARQVGSDPRELVVSLGEAVQEVGGADTDSTT